MTFLARLHLSVDVVSIRRKFYASLNSVFSRSSALAEPVKLQLVRSFCLPLLVYCLGAIDLNVNTVRELDVCWNDAFRKIFHYRRSESVKQLQYFCGCLDFVHMYHLARLRFLSHLVYKLPFVDSFVSSLEFQYHDKQKLFDLYNVRGQSFSAAVHCHFHAIVMQQYLKHIG